MKSYTIGDVSRHLGISRDTLRFYEKKGILKPHKLKNGYRSYSYEDLRTLQDILFFRRFNFSLEEISLILHQGSYHFVIDLVEKKIEEEKRSLEQHRQSLTHLLFADQLYQNIGQYNGSCDLRHMPAFYMIDPDCLRSLPNVYDLCYVFEEYWVTPETVQLTDKYMMISIKTASIVNVSHQLGDQIFRLDQLCLYTILESDQRSPSPESLAGLCETAAANGHKISGRAYCGFLLNCSKEGKSVYYIEVYLPLQEEESRETSGQR